MKERMLLYLTDRYPEVLAHLREDGAYLNDAGQKMIYGQCDGLYFSALYSYDHPANPYYKKREALDWAVRCWEFYYTLTRENGQTQIITFDQYWHDHYEEWCTLHWLNTIELIGPYLSTERLARWKARCYASCEGIYRHVKQDLESGRLAEQLSRHAVANHYLWETVCAYRYGIVANRQDIQGDCVRVMQMAAGGMHPAGTWLEGGSLVVGYSSVSYGALAQFCDYAQDKHPTVTAAVKAAADYLLNTSYGIMGPRIAALDIRQRLKEDDGGMSYLPGSLCDDEAMRRFVSVNLRRLEENPIKLTGQGLGFFTEFFLTMPEDVMWAEDDLIAPCADYAIPDLKARVLRRGGWTVAMCCHEQQTLNNRWIMERMNLFSIYHEDIGEIVGGGQSTSTPHLSCFEVIQNGIDEYLPKDTAILSDAIGMSLCYNGARCSIVFEEIGDRKVVVRYRTEGLMETAKVYIHVPLYVCGIDSLSVNGETIALREGAYRSTILPAGAFAVHRGTSLSLSRDAVFMYPEDGFNPYLQVQKPLAPERYGVLTCALDYARPEAVLTLEL